MKPAIGFLTKDGQGSFTDKVAAILQWMTNNPSYPNPVPDLGTVQTAFTAYKVATADASQGGKQNIAVRNARREELTGLMRQLSSYVSATANGDLEVLISSGFPVQKPSRTPIGPLPAPDAPVVVPGPVTGSLKATSTPLYGASSYNWSVALQSEPETDVKTAQTTGARAEFTGLTPGQIYVVCLNAVGTAGVSDWSDGGTLMVV
ncbi:MAG: hypothetical protein K8R23_15585 [Chthoniobacter sp.]|nr:hypothetical protein [Chthoniobacter sp.]